MSKGGYKRNEGTMVLKAALRHSGAQGDRGIEMLPRIMVGSTEPRFVRTSGKQGQAYEAEGNARGIM